jgi:hypothetical protein
MKRYILGLSLAAACTFGAVASAQAGVVTFNFNDPRGATPPSQFPLTSGGLVFTSTSVYTYIVPSDAWAPKPGNGTNYLVFDAGTPGQHLAITQDGGGAFDLYSIDMMQSLYTPNSSPLDHVNIAYKVGGITHLLLNEPVGDSFQTLTLNLDDVTEVDIFRLKNGTAPGYWGLDNVSSSASGPVPEPATWAIMLTGFMGIGAIVRRRRQISTAGAG